MFFCSVNRHNFVISGVTTNLTMIRTLFLMKTSRFRAFPHVPRPQNSLFSEYSVSESFYHVLMGGESGARWESILTINVSGNFCLHKNKYIQLPS